MSSSECALCNVIITSANDTREHIIPNAIGGRKKVKGFICKACNNSTGNSWESELAKQLNPLSLFFGIKRERGSAPSQVFETTAGDKLNLNADGSMSYEKFIYTETPFKDNRGVQINIRARTMKEAKTLLNRAKENYPDVDINKISSDLKFESSYSPDMLKFDMSFGGHDAGRSIVKSALALASSSGIPSKLCTEAISYLKNEASEACFGYFYEFDLIKNRPKGIPIHCVSIKGCKNTEQVIAYVEYFGIQRVVLCLSKSYKGKDVTNTYAINPMTGEELELAVELNLTNNEIREAYEYKKIPTGSVEKACEKVIPTGMVASYDKEKNRVVNKAIQKAFENCGAKEGEKLTQEHMEKVKNRVLEELMPFILHQMSQSHLKD